MLFTIRYYKKLARKLSEASRVPLGRTKVELFSNGELYVRVMNPVAGEKVFVLATMLPPDENFLESLILINALKANGAKEIVFVMPAAGYDRQDKIDQDGAPVTVELMAKALVAAGAQKIIAVDLHSDGFSSYAPCETENLLTHGFFAEKLKTSVPSPFIVVAPDKGGGARAELLADALGSDFTVLKKVRGGHNRVKRIIIPEPEKIKNNNIIIFEDIIDTAGTLMKTAEELKKHGAKDIYVAATHPVLSGPAIERLQKALFKRIFVTDSVSLPEEKRMKKMKVLSIIPLLKGKLQKL